MSTLTLQPPRVAMVDPRTGMVTREWYRWFTDSFLRQGGASAPTVTEVVTRVETVENEMIDTWPTRDGAMLRSVEELQSDAPWCGPDNALMRRLEEMQMDMERTGIECATLVRRLDDMEVALQASTLANGALTRLTEELSIALQSAITTNSDLARRVATLENGVL